MDNIKEYIENNFKNNNESSAPELSKELIEKIIVYLTDINNIKSKLNKQKITALITLICKSRKYVLGC